ncbi:nucleoporin-62 C-terminal-like protein [Psammomys obesus]|uniref:nucleoporin-62 C-terminal-like protein n=1 Tax=Psammomys obesus TaxID=48139 RepID=UPI0024528E32|nr:nucleoporin-62 C-terminal-like protein [Psammomys obesus]
MMFSGMSHFPAYMASQGLASTTSTSTSTTVTTNTTTTMTSGFNLYVKTPASPWVDNAGLVSVASLPVTMSVNSIVTPVMTYGHLDSMENNWNLHPQEQGSFLHQENKYSAWNNTFIDYGDEIAILYNEVEKVKLDQKRLEHELNCILTQQKELEHLLIPLEEFLKEQNGPLNVFIDKEYEIIYKLAEHIDAELKKMSQDLRDIIVYLNSLARPANIDEQLQQISKILNAHMESLYWISQNSGIMYQKVQEITKVFEKFRKEQEKNMKTAF